MTDLLQSDLEVNERMRVSVSTADCEWYKKRSRFSAAAVTLNSHVFFIRVTSLRPDVWITQYYQTIDTRYALKYIDALIYSFCLKCPSTYFI